MDCRSTLWTPIFPDLVLLWPKKALFLAKTAVFGHKRLQTPQMAGKSGSNGGSQLNTCRRTNLGAKLVRKTHPVVWKWPQSDPFEAKKKSFLAPNGQISGHFRTTGCIFLTSFAPRVVPPHVFNCDPPFDPLLPAILGVWGLLWPKMALLVPNGPLWAISTSLGAFF